MTDELVEFLLARIGEDETIARAATQSVKWWDWPGREGRAEATVRAHEDPYIALNVTNGDAAHIARYDPRRVLADCAIRRRLVETPSMVTTWTLQVLASMYDTHPDYQERWRS